MFVIARVLALAAFGWILAAGSPGDPPTPSPSVVVEGATPAQADRLALALARFAEAGLKLPDLHVEFPTDPEGCHGHLGLFAFRHGAARIVICGEEEFVYEHELAHAWEATRVSDGTRAAFMEYRGYETWSSSTVPWRERGVEGAAFIIQQGVAGLPLPPILSAELVSRSVAYELLTNRPAPRLIDWMSQGSVACSERPTPLASSVPDAAGLRCTRPQEASDAHPHANPLPAHAARKEVLDGLLTKQIARRLQISEYTVQDHLKSIFAKTGTATRGELCAELFTRFYRPRTQERLSPSLYGFFLDD